MIIRILFIHILLFPAFSFATTCNKSVDMLLAEYLGQPYEEKIKPLKTPKKSLDHLLAVYVDEDATTFLSHGVDIIPPIPQKVFKRPSQTALSPVESYPKLQLSSEKKEMVILDINPNTQKPWMIEGRTHRVYSTAEGRMIDLNPPYGYKFKLKNPEFEIKKVDLSKTVLVDTGDDFSKQHKFNQERLGKLFKNDNFNQFTVKIGQGGFNHVYLVHPNRLPKGIVAGSSEHIQWAIKNNENLKVIRLMQDNGENSIKMLEYEYAVMQLVDKLAEGATMNGKPFVRVARDFTTQADFQMGVTRREFVQGPTAAQIQDAVDRLSLKVDGSMDMTEDVAIGILSDAGFISPSGKPDLVEARSMVRAIESFAKDSDTAVNQFKGEQGWNSVYNYSSAKDVTGTLKSQKLDSLSNADRIIENNGGQYEIVGIDYNRGQNVIWSAKEKMWIFIDA